MNRLNQFFKPFVIELSVVIQFYFISQNQRARCLIQSLSRHKRWAIFLGSVFLILGTIIAITTTFFSTQESITAFFVLTGIQSILFTFAILLMVDISAREGFNCIMIFNLPPYAFLIEQLPSKSLRDLPFSESLTLGSIMTIMVIYLIPAICFAYNAYLSFRFSYLLNEENVELLNLIEEAQSIERQSANLETSILVSQRVAQFMDAVKALVVFYIVNEQSSFNFYFINNSQNANKRGNFGTELMSVCTEILGPGYIPAGAHDHFQPSRLNEKTKHVDNEANRTLLQNSTHLSQSSSYSINSQLHILDEWKQIYKSQGREESEMPIAELSGFTQYMCDKYRDHQ